MKRHHHDAAMMWSGERGEKEREREKERKRERGEGKGGRGRVSLLQVTQHTIEDH